MARNDKNTTGTDKKGGKFIYDTMPSVSSIDFSDIKGRKLLFNLKGGDNANLSTMVDKVVEVEHVVLYPGVFLEVDETSGELLQEPGEKAFIVTPAGVVYYTFSLGLLSSIHTLLETFGPPPYKPGLKIKLKNKKTRDGNQTYVFDLVD